MVGFYAAPRCLTMTVFLASCAFIDVHELAKDETQGRNNNTPGSTLAQQYLIDQLDLIAEGANPTGTGDNAFKQTFTDGTNIIAVIPGTDLADEYVMVGGHYDHLGTSCRNVDPNESICNGATDNAAGAAAVLNVGRAIALGETPPRRSVILALWDREEDGLLGSRAYVQNPLVPLADTVAYINFDIQGANLRPALRNMSFAIGPETGGSRLQQLVGAAIASTDLDTHQVSSIFGQGRSDYIILIGADVPTVFFSDSTGPCYHTDDDEIGVVDFGKLQKQINIAIHLTRSLVSTNNLPTFVGDAPVATYSDAVELQEVGVALIKDIDTFPPSVQTQILNFVATLDQIVDDGPAQFDNDDVSGMLSGALNAVNALTGGPCDGFLDD